MPLIFSKEIAFNNYFNVLSWKKKLYEVLHPNPIPGEIPQIDKTLLVQYPLIENRENVFIVRFKDLQTNEITVGKILLPINDGLRDHTTRAKRHAVLKKAAQRNVLFSPEGVCIGLRPILPSFYNKKDLAVFGNVVSASEELDPRFEYVWFMYRLREEESIDKKIQRNVAILRPLAEAIFDIHQRSDMLTPQQAWTYANKASLQEKFHLNLKLFSESLSKMKPFLTKDELNEIWPDSVSEKLKYLGEEVFMNTSFQRIVENRIKGDYIKRGHGDIKMKNIWFSDFYRKDKVRNFKECVTFIDAVDFNDSFNSIDILSESAMLMVDIQKELSPYEYGYFMQCYIAKYPTWNYLLDLLLAYYKLEKAMTSSYISFLYDGDYQSSKKFLWMLRNNIIEMRQCLDRLAG